VKNFLSKKCTHAYFSLFDIASLYYVFDRGIKEKKLKLLHGTFNLGLIAILCL
jgi:hypothetical protein